MRYFRSTAIGSAIGSTDPTGIPRDDTPDRAGSGTRSNYHFYVARDESGKARASAIVEHQPSDYERISSSDLSNEWAEPGEQLRLFDHYAQPANRVVIGLYSHPDFGSRTAAMHLLAMGDIASRKATTQGLSADYDVSAFSGRLVNKLKNRGVIHDDDERDYELNTNNITFKDVESALSLHNEDVNELSYADISHRLPEAKDHLRKLLGRQPRVSPVQFKQQTLWD